MTWSQLDWEARRRLRPARVVRVGIAGRPPGRAIRRLGQEHFARSQIIAKIVPKHRTRMAQAALDGRGERITSHSLLRPLAF